MIFNLVLLGFMVNQSGAFPVPLDKFPESEAQVIGVSINNRHVD
jgi:hypothetical protein